MEEYQQQTPDAGMVGENHGMMSFVPNEVLEAQEVQAEENRKWADEDQADPFISSLSSHVRTCWQEARDNKDQDITPRLLKCLRLRKGEYTSSQKANIEKIQGDPTLFDQLTNVKCRAAESWLHDVLLRPGERPWAVRSTPSPDLKPETMERFQIELKSEYDRMIFAYSQTVDPNDPTAVHQMNAEIYKELLGFKDEFLKDIKEESSKEMEAIELDIDDAITEGKWYDSLREVISDVVGFPTAFMKGPVVRQKKVLKWGEDGAPIVERDEVREWDRVSPLDMFPSPTAKTLQDGYLIQRHRFSRSDLNDLIGVEGYNENAIRKILREHGEGGLREWLYEDDERADLEDRPNDNLSSQDSIDCLEFWGSVQGSKLLNWGLEKEEVPDEDIDYAVNCFLVGSDVFGARLNPDPLGRKPYYSASYGNVTDSIWGNSVPELLEPKQKVINGCLQAMVRNMGMASGPMTWANMSKMDPSVDPSEIYPLKFFPFSDDMSSSGPPMGFFQPDPIIDVLLKLYDYFYKQAGEDPGIPNYMYGANEQGGAARTASGLSMLMNAAAKVLRTVAENIDVGIIAPSITDYRTHLMLNEPEKATGDINIVARGSEYLVQVEQLQIRRQEFLQTTSNEFDFQIMGLNGRAEVLRETCKSLKMRSDKIVPDNDAFSQNISEKELQMYLQNLSQMLHIPPEQLEAIAKGQTPGGGAPPPSAQSLGPDGQPTMGQDLGKQ